MSDIDVRDLDLELTRPGFYLRPDYFQVLAALREQSPVHRSGDMFAVTRYEAIRAISRDPERFVSSRGVLVNDPLRNAGGLPANTFSILHLDPPLHATYRKLVNRQFTPKAVVTLEDEIRATVRQVLDDAGADAGRPIDFIDRVAGPIPIGVIAEFFGVGDADRDLFRRWSDAAIASTDGGADVGGDAEFALMAQFLLDHIESPVAESNGVLALLKEVELDGRPLNGVEIMGFCMTLLVAGNETTRTLISGGVEALAAHPDQRAALVADPSLIPAAVEEILRWVTPIQAFGRTAVVDVELDGVAIAAGDFVVMLYASGNRDERIFGPTADRFDISRPVSPTHVAFGFGEHLCLGASLARLEARVFFEELLVRFPHYELAGESTYASSTLVRGAVRMPVLLHP